MQTKNKVMEALAWLVFSTLSIGFALLSDGLAGGTVSSLGGLWRDLVTLNPSLWLRVVWWLMLLVQAAWLVAMVRRWRRD